MGGPRVLFLSGELPPMQGGVGDYTALLAAALERLDVSCEVVTTADRGVPASPNVFPVVPRWSARDWPVLARLIEARRPAILHIQYQTAAFGMRPLINLLPLLLRASRGPLRVVTTYHDLRVPYLFPKAGPVRAWANWLLAAASHARITTNDEDFARMTSMLGTPVRGTPRRRDEPSLLLGPRASSPAPTLLADEDARDPRTGPITQTPNDVDYIWAEAARTALIPIGSNIRVNPPPDYSRDGWRARLGVSNGETLLCFFGLLNHSKGVDTLLSAMGQTPPHAPVKLVIIGGTAGDSDQTNVLYRQQMLDLCRVLRLEDRVIWTGYTGPDAVSGHLLACDACVLPFRDGASFRRGSLLAALTHALPVVSTVHPSGRAQGAGPARLRSEENCLLVPPDDPAALRAAILRVQEQPHLRERLGAGASALGRTFTWERIAAATLRVYESLQ